MRSLYQEFRVPLLRNVSQLTGGDRQWAEDVVQETVLRAWRHARRLRWERGSLWAWLMTVARRIVIDDWRYRGTRPHEVEAERGEEPPVPDVSETMLSSLVVSQALLGLSDRHREVLVEIYLRDRTVNEVAESLEVPPGTVKSRVYYALRALRTQLGEEGAA
ncbi:sigma-70 family RNA polymerase sigma factor [Allosalinactinospora lopnorensis]|uniref:sigma-70 family RNA polymerase sigma factor n=1 Tax=Allosalinactinospora lopnorensis TaxID=1352348 RepID=UPI0006962E9D|nr:sigma-70 family RNA polymerase sigma factor [Allosalinactinospora lopnorensis]